MQTGVKMLKNRVLEIQMGATTKLHLCCTPLYPVAFYLFPGNSQDVHEKRKLIESIHSRNNNYLLIDITYDNNKTLVLAKAHEF